MGREIRMVPPNWQHPEDGLNRVGMTKFKPMYDERFDDALAKWLADFDRIRSGDLTDLERECYPRGLADWLGDEGTPPSAGYYHDFAPEDATWFQMYETVTEGTPVTPPFATKAELIEHLVSHGTWSDEYNIRAGWEPGPAAWSREAAEGFVNAGYAPSMIISGGVISTARDSAMYNRGQKDD